MAHITAHEPAFTAAPARPARSTRSARHIGLWALQICAAAMFLMAGSFKLAGAPQAVALFESIGLGQWLRYLTGVLECGGALLLLAPSLAGIGALLLAGVMVGAVFTEVIILGGNPVPATVLLIVTAVIAYGRRDHIARLPRR